jgi:protein involved in polysaccharide export with SLBB domain
MIHSNKLAHREGFGRRLVILLCLFSSCSFSLRAQQPTSRVGPAEEPPFGAVAAQSDLTKDNLNLVAASATHLKEILTQDPGLMVELKRWMALDASNNGQMMNEEDLKDDAVFERLTKDVKFRSVVTRLVQRYGYLLPNVNPGSEMGKEQDLLLKERVRRLVQIEAQEDAETLKSPRQGSGSVETKSKTCNLNPNDCIEATPSPPPPSFSMPQGLPDRDVPPAYPGDQQSLPTSPRILQADRSPADPTYEPSPANGVAFLQTGAGSSPSQESLSFSDLPQNYLRNSAPDRTRTFASAGSEASTPEAVGPASLTPAVPTIGKGASEPTLVTDRQSSPPTLVRRPNPYADIPSLYDLYVQAPARDVPPQRFGLAVFHDGLRDPRSIPMDLPVGPDYVIGPGDTLNIDLWGGYSTKLVRVVDRQGRVSLPDAGPVPVSGRSLGEVQDAVQKVVTGLYRDTSADVSVGRLRTIRVYVVGEVTEPGAYDISSLSTALNALVAAGGVTPKGSLRTLKHMRGRQEIEQIDAYDLLLHGVSPDARKLENGDTLMVPPIGPEITVTGMVRRPAVYELNDEKTVAEVFALAGGILPAAALKHVEVQRLEAHEKRTMLSLDLSPDATATSEITSFRVQDGDVIHIFPIAPYSQGTIYLEGHVLRPGRYSYKDGIKLTDLIASYQDILPEPAAHYAEIIRLNPPDLHPSVVSFDLAEAMKDPSAAPVLYPLDTVRIFSRFDFELPPTVSVNGEVRRPGTYRTSGQITLRDAVFLAGGLTPDAALTTAQVFRFNADGTSEIFTVKLRDALDGNSADNILLQPRDRLLIHTNKFRVEPSFVEITGAVAKPGRYPYTGNMHAEDLIRAAGGLKDSADTTKADLTSYSEDGAPGTHLDIALASLANGDATEDVSLRPGDVLTIRQKTGWKNMGASVAVDGEVMHPGTFGVEPGEHLSSVLERAGGYTPQAYPYGAVLMRREVRDLETKNQDALITRLKAEREQLKLLPEGDTDQKNAKLNAIAQTDSQLSQLATNAPVGRVVIHIDKNIKEWKNTAADITLRDGDTLVVPKKANVVMVNGQVFNPTAINAVPGHSAKWYLSQAGGLTPLADKKAVFVVRADGSVISAKNNNDNWWSGNPLDAPLRPGDTLVVPEKTPKIGGPNWQLVMQSAQVAASVGLALAYIHP